MMKERSRTPKSWPAIATVFTNRQEKPVKLKTMLSKTSQKRSKIIFNSNKRHPLARFVTEETAALMFGIEPQQIYRIECWRNMVYVHGIGVSRFVSYADFPPVLGVAGPTFADFRRWRRRWYKRWRQRLAPEFWTRFFIYQFKQAETESDRQEWGELIAEVKALMSETELYKLRKLYSPEKYWQAGF